MSGDIKQEVIIAPSVQPKVLNNNSLRLDPLLDMSETEKYFIATRHIISGFALISGGPSFVESNIASIPTGFQAASLGIFGVAGAAVGSYLAKKQINDERDKIVSINKELFLLFNLAADKYEEWHNKFKGDEKAISHEDASLETNRLEKEYYDILIEILVGISSKTTAKSNYTQQESQSQETNRDQVCYTQEVHMMDAVIKEYLKHTAIGKPGRVERELWESLKKHEVYGKDEIQQEFFVKHNSKSKVKEFFEEKVKEHKIGYDAAVKELQDVLAKAENEKKVNDDKEYKESKAALITTLQGIYDVANLYSRKIANGQQKIDDQEPEVIKDLYTKPVNEAYEKVFQKITNPNTKLDIKIVCENKLFKQILLVEENLGRLFSHNAKENRAKTPAIFGEEGSFRKFWRALPEKEYETKVDENTTVKVSINFEQNIHRGGKVPDAKSCGVMSLGVAAGLFATGKGLYVAAVALGAIALSSTGIGLIIAAVAIALTLLCMYCYYKSQKAQSDRDVLLTQLGKKRLAVMNQKAKEMEPLSPRIPSQVGSPVAMYRYAANGSVIAPPAAGQVRELGMMKQ